jgi:hypothetical protein
MACRSRANATKPRSRPGATATVGRTRPRRPLLKHRVGLTLAPRRVPRVWALDAARFGLKVWYRRRWCPEGLRPPWLDDAQYEWLWL